MSTPEFIEGYRGMPSYGLIIVYMLVAFLGTVVGVLTVIILSEHGMAVAKAWNMGRIVAFTSVVAVAYLTYHGVMRSLRWWYRR